MERQTRQRAWLRSVLKTFIAFLLGVLGNMLVIFITQTSLRSVPTLFWIFIILLLTIASIFAVVWPEKAGKKTMARHCHCICHYSRTYCVYLFCTLSLSG